MSYEEYKKNYVAGASGKTTDELCRERDISFRPMIFEAHGGGFGQGFRDILAIMSAGMSEK